MRILGLRILGVAALFTALLFLPYSFEQFPTKDTSSQSYGNVRVLASAYERWKARAKQNNEDRQLTLRLGYSKGLSSEFSQANGKVSFDLFTGSVSAEVFALPSEEIYDLWLVHNRPGYGRSVKPEPGDVMLRVGSLKREEKAATLSADLPKEALAGFTLDLAVLTRAGKNPSQEGVLFASPSLFQRLLHSEIRGRRLTEVSPFPKLPAPTFLSAPYQFLVPAPAHADVGDELSLAALVAKGETLFFKEKFAGNGRTCGTCHPAQNNLTLDRAFISRLPNKDPLFVAEFVDALNSAKNGGRRFEIPQLMRQEALILENLDGFDDLKNRFVMRGVPHTFAQGISITPAVFDGTSSAVSERTGWSGDGAPGNGTLREFAIGAVTQHFTRTLNRVAGVDFRLPDDAELDAMEAFMLSLGRQAELDLTVLNLRDGDAGAGLALFNGPSAGKCSQCHSNAGANVSFFPSPQNANFNTGVEDFLQNSIPPGSLRPRDGGFGRDAHPNGSFGDQTFNTPVLVEAADTPPFFHNNIVDTIEEAVDFYTSPEFGASPAGAFIGGISLTDSQVNQVAAFLRVINVLENIRQSRANLLKGAAEPTLIDAQKFLRLSIADILDAIRVLRQSPLSSNGLHPVAQSYLTQARNLSLLASQTKLKILRNTLIKASLVKLDQATQDIVIE